MWKVMKAKAKHIIRAFFYPCLKKDNHEAHEEHEEILYLYLLRVLCVLRG
jgi:hypothetical protein